ncbi:hypothetical protein [Spirosoma jeollabukense]
MDWVGVCIIAWITALGGGFGPTDIPIFTAAAVGLTIRLLFIRYGWHMPKFVYRDEPAEGH